MQYFKDDLNEEELKKEYRKLAKEYHPDVNKNPNANEIMAEINRQFDEYFTNQALREYSWVDTMRQKREANKVRATLLVYLRRDKDNPGTWFTHVEERYYYFWFLSTRSRFTAVTIPNDKSWDNFRGGFAYCSYDQPDEYDRVRLTKLPATITPANEKELYWYLKDHWGDTAFEHFSLLRTRFGDFWARDTDSNKGYVFYVKVELPKKYMELESGSLDIDGPEKYTARSIDTVFVNNRWIQEAKLIDDCDGKDFRYRLFLECTAQEFNETHDVDYVPQFSEAMNVKPISDSDLYFIKDPMVWYYAKHGIVCFYCARDNFRIRYGTFDSDGLRRNMHLLNVEDAEIIQDVLDELNQSFDDEVRRRIKSGKIKIKI